MQRSPITQFVVFFALLCAYSQAFPLLDRSSALKPSSKTESPNHNVKLNRPDDDGQHHHRGDGQHGNDELELVAFHERPVSQILSKQQPSNDKLANHVEPLDQSSALPNIWDPSTPNQAPLAVQASDPLLSTPQAKITTTPSYSTSSQSTSSRQRNANSDLRLTTSTEAAENQLVQAYTRGQRFFRQRDGSLAISLPLRAFEAPPLSPASKRPSLPSFNDLHASSFRDPLSHFPNEQHGRSRDPLAHQSPPSWFSLPFRRYHGSRVPQHQRASSEPYPLRHALSSWFSLGRQGGKSRSAIPVVGVAGKPVSEREPIFSAGWRRIFGESVQRSPSLGEPETVFSGERGEQLLFASDQYEHPVPSRASLLNPEHKKPYLGISWDREERAFREAKELLSKASNHLMTFVPTVVDGVAIPKKITSAQAPPWTQAHSILLEKERKETLAHKPPTPFFQGLHALLIKHTIRPSSPYRFKLPALSGTIHMTSPSQHVKVPIIFNLTPQTCLHHTLEHPECECLSQDVADQLLEAYMPTSSEHTTISRSVSTLIKAVEHRATLELTLNSSQPGGVDKASLQSLLGLLLSTKQQLSHTSTKFSSITTHGALYNISFNATWSFTQFIDGVPRVCA